MIAEREKDPRFFNTCDTLTEAKRGKGFSVFLLMACISGGSRCCMEKRSVMILTTI